MTDKVCPTCKGTGKLPRTCGLCKWYLCIEDQDDYNRYCIAPVPIAAYSKPRIISGGRDITHETEKDRDASQCPCYCARTT